MSKSAEWLKSFLSSGEQPAVKVFAEAAKRHYSKSTIKRAKAEVGAEASQRANAWYWSLPVQASEQPAITQPLGMHALAEQLEQSQDGPLVPISLQPEPTPIQILKAEKLALSHKSPQPLKVEWFIHRSWPLALRKRYETPEDQADMQREAAEKLKRTVKPEPKTPCFCDGDSYYVPQFAAIFCRACGGQILVVSDDNMETIQQASIKAANSGQPFDVRTLARRL